MRRQKDELQPADEKRDGHDDEPRVLQRRDERLSGRALVNATRHRRRLGNLVGAPGKPGRGDHDDGERDKADDADAPAIAVRKPLADRRGNHGADRSGGRDDAIDEAAQLRRDGARGDRHRQRRRGAGKRSADQNAGADHHGDKPVRGGKRHKTDDIHERAGNHDRAKAEARRQCAGDGLQEAPSKVLDGDRQREIGHRNVDVVRQRLHEQAEALTQTHAEAEHDRRADEDRQRRSERTQICT